MPILSLFNSSNLHPTPPPPPGSPERQLLLVTCSLSQHTWVFFLLPNLFCRQDHIKQTLGSLEWQLLHINHILSEPGCSLSQLTSTSLPLLSLVEVAYSHIQHTWVFFSSPSSISLNLSSKFSWICQGYLCPTLATRLGVFSTAPLAPSILIKWCSGLFRPTPTVSASVCSWPRRPFWPRPPSFSGLVLQAIRSYT